VLFVLPFQSLIQNDLFSPPDISQNPIHFHNISTLCHFYEQIRVEKSIMQLTSLNLKAAKSSLIS
jgi:hypothetical protein